MHTRQWKESSRRRIAGDVSDLVRDVEDYLAASGGQAGEALAGARARLLAAVASTRATLEQAEREAAARVRVAGRATDSYVHEHTWQALAAAACAGVVAGWLAGRR